MIGATNRVYPSAVVRADAIPLLLPVLDGADAEEVVSGLDGLLLSGGGDMAAWCYGSDAVPETYGVDTERDAWELALVHEAQAIGLPILGICRGAQVLNVAAGGTLIQHLPAFTAEAHRVCARDSEEVHSVRVEPSSMLFEVTGRLELGVNSLHHQAVGRVGAGLRPVAWSPDGIIEAIESDEGCPVLAVQWHPELLVQHPGHPELFGWLAREAMRFRCESAPTSLAGIGHRATPIAPLAVEVA